MRRYTTTSKPESNPFENDLPKYHQVADETLAVLQEKFELLDSSEIEDFDIKEAYGVLEINFGKSGGTYVINKQTPNKQLWFSSPLSGPKRFNYSLEKGEWVNTRDGKSLFQILDSEIYTLLNQNLGLVK
uniref:ferroxidase n=1 Tax=Arcella intermedia TaxID=1963864 RepID=A0A6B2LQC0_9EUKA